MQVEAQRQPGLSRHRRSPVRQAGQDKNRNKQVSPKSDKAEQEVSDNSVTGHVSKDTDSAG